MAQLDKFLTAAPIFEWLELYMVITSLPHSEALLINKMVTIIVEVAKPDKIILFGSRAKGNAGADSDYDFLIVDAEPFGIGHSRRKTAGKIWRALAPLKVPTDILMYNLNEVEKWSQSRNHVIFNALTEGTVVYERAK
jgi:uncharacterized protein